MRVTYKEPELLFGRLLLRHEIAEGSDEVEHGQCAQTHCRVKLRPWKALECIDDHQVSWATVVNTSNAQEGRHLTRSNTDSCTRHERCDGHQGNQFDNAAKASKTNE